MATSGNIRQAAAFGYVDLAWSLSSQSINNNTSTITYTLSIYRSNISSSAAKNYSISINGTTVASGTTTIGGSGTKTIKTGTTTVTHNADGTKTFALSFSQDIKITWSGSWIGTLAQSGSGTLDTIPRATQPTLDVSTVEMGTSFTITMNRASDDFSHTLEYSFGEITGTIGEQLGVSKVWAAPVTLAAQIPNATSGTATLICKTYDGNTLIGEKPISIILTVPASVAPTINSVAIVEAVTSPAIATTFSNFVQNNSKAQVNTIATGAHSSTIVSCKVMIKDANAMGTPTLATYYSALDGGTYYTTTDILAYNTTLLKFAVQVTDSRGRSASVTYDKALLAYSLPKITSFNAFRSDANGDPNYDSTNLKITVNFNIATVDNLNGKYYEILYKVKGAANWAGTIVSANIYTRNESFITSGITFSSDNAYELRLNIYDTFASAYAVVDIPTAFTLLDFRNTGKGVAFGKVSEADELEIAMDIDLTGELLQEDRRTPTLLNNWVNYGTSYESAVYWKDKCNIVHLAGLIKSGTTTDGTVIFNLPTGYRPRAPEKFITISLNAICTIDVYTSGDVTIRAGANSGWLSLSGISFRAV